MYFHDLTALKQKEEIREKNATKRAKTLKGLPNDYYICNNHVMKIIGNSQYVSAVECESHSDAMLVLLAYYKLCD